MSTNGNGSLDAIVAKLHKLMQLTSERGATEHEAALAAAHVQRLLAEHNLSMAVVEASGGDTGTAGQREKGKVSRRQVYRWQRALMEAIARLNYCHLTLNWIYRESTSRTFDGYELIGRAANVATARHTFEYLVETIERLLRQDVNGDPSRFFTRYAHSFKEGMSDRLIERLNDKRYELEQEARDRAETARRHSGTAHSAGALITLDDVSRNEHDLNEDFRLGLKPGTTAARRAEQEAQSAAAATARRQRKASLIAEGISEDIADWMSWGYTREAAEKMCAPEAPTNETDAQRRKREAKEERERDKRYARWDREAAREHARLDRTAYRKGKAAGDTVGLDPQIKAGSNSKRIGR